MHPNDQGVRIEAIESPHLPMVLEAGAGSGKTDTMVRRLVRAIELGTPHAKKQGNPTVEPAIAPIPGKHR